jgi:hypothetical protein
MATTTRPAAPTSAAILPARNEPPGSRARFKLTGVAMQERRFKNRSSARAYAELHGIALVGGPDQERVRAAVAGRVLGRRATETELFERLAALKDTLGFANLADWAARRWLEFFCRADARVILLILDRLLGLEKLWTDAGEPEGSLLSAFLSESTRAEFTTDHDVLAVVRSLGAALTERAAQCAGAVDDLPSDSAAASRPAIRTGIAPEPR